MTTFQLIAPDLVFMPSYIEALAEGHRRGASPLATPEDLAAMRADPAGWLAAFTGPRGRTRINEQGEEVERVPETYRWLVSGGQFVGDAGIRHHLNAQLEKSGGHIGYGVRPSWQRRGAATEMLRLCLIFAREELKLPRVLLSCNVENIASARVIEKNGGILVDITPYPFQPEKQQKRFWIETSGA